jgi:DNA-binding LytR/AlgR family response regulator
VVLLNGEDDIEQCIRALNISHLFHVVAHSTSYLKAMELIRVKEPDLVIVDSPYLEQLDEAFNRCISSLNTILVHTSSKDENLIKAINSHAFALILKPYEPGMLRVLHNKLNRMFQDLLPQSIFERVMNQSSKIERRCKVVLESLQGLIVKKPEDIIYLKSSGNQTLVRMVDGADVMLKTTLKQVEERLQYAGFIRICNDILVNSWNVISYQYESGLVKVLGGNTFKVAVARRKGFRQFMFRRY